MSDAASDTSIGTQVTGLDLSADPYPTYQRLRDEGACCWLAAANRWVITRWDEVFSLDERPELVAGEPDSLMTRAMGLSMLRTDGATHRRQRQPAHQPLRGREFDAQWAGMLDRVAGEVLNDFAARGEADLVADFAGPFAAHTLKLLLGIDDVDDRDLQTWSQALIDGIGNYADDPEVWARCDDASRGIDAAIERGLSKAGEGTVLHSLAHSGSLSEDEIRANVKLFISGGLNEPRDVISSAIWALLSDPEQEALVRAEPSRFADAAEETLRWLSPIGMYPRYVAEDVTVGGIDLSAGSRIGVLIASANRDERHWDDPDRFDLRRATQRHIAFSRGAHVCLGALVARRQVGHSALPALFARLPGLQLADGFTPDLAGWVFRGLRRLDVTWEAA